MAENHDSQVQVLEHDDTNNVHTKKVLLYGWDTGNARPVKLVADSDGNLQSETAITPASSATATVTSVADSASNQTLLASNTNRKGASIHNDSTVDLYVKLGTTATTTDFTIKMAANSYYEVPYNYTGRIDGIWASDASGSARITEFT